MKESRNQKHKIYAVTLNNNTYWLPVYIVGDTKGLYVPFRWSLTVLYGSSSLRITTKRLCDRISGRREMTRMSSSVVQYFQNYVRDDEYVKSLYGLKSIQAADNVFFITLSEFMTIINEDCKEFNTTPMAINMNLELVLFKSREHQPRILKYYVEDGIAKIPFYCGLRFIYEQHMDVFRTLISNYVDLPRDIDTISDTLKTHLPYDPLDIEYCDTIEKFVRFICYLIENDVLKMKVNALQYLLSDLRQHAADNTNPNQYRYVESYSSSSSNSEDAEEEVEDVEQVISRKRKLELEEEVKDELRSYYHQMFQKAVDDKVAWFNAAMDKEAERIYMAAEHEMKKYKT